MKIQGGQVVLRWAKSLYYDFGGGYNQLPPVEIGLTDNEGYAPPPPCPSSDSPVLTGSFPLILFVLQNSGLLRFYSDVSNDGPETGPAPVQIPKTP